jgi:hypothetical protein
MWRGVYAGTDTSCPFALNVAADYTGSGPDYANSPVTGLPYTMNCRDRCGARGAQYHAIASRNYVILITPAGNTQKL